MPKSKIQSGYSSAQVCFWVSLNMLTCPLLEGADQSTVAAAVASSCCRIESRHSQSCWSCLAVPFPGWHQGKDLKHRSHGQCKTLLLAMSRRQWACRKCSDRHTSTSCATQSKRVQVTINMRLYDLNGEQGACNAKFSRDELTLRDSSQVVSFASPAP